MMNSDEKTPPFLRAKPLKESLDEERRKILELIEQQGGGEISVPFGFPDLDVPTRGLVPGLSVVAARPYIQISDFGMHVALVNSQKHGVLYVAASYDKDTLVKRMLSRGAYINLSNIKEGFVADRDVLKMDGAVERISRLESRLFIHDEIKNVPQICAAYESYRNKCGIGLIIVDTFQRVLPTKMAAYEAKSKTEEAVSTLDNLAKNNGVPILLLSEIDSASDRNNKNRRPMLGHISDSGAFQYRAKPIIILHDTSLDNEYSEDDFPRDESDVSYISAYVERNVDGNLRFEVRLTYLQGYGRIESAARVGDDDVPMG